MEGRVIAAHGRQYVVELADGTLLPCFRAARRARSPVATGDIMRTSDDQGVVEAIQPRVSLLYRSNEIRQKLIAANVDQLVIVVATEPAFSDELVARALLAAESEEIAPLIVLNKCDLADKLPPPASAWPRWPGSATHSRTRPSNTPKTCALAGRQDQRAGRPVRHGQIDAGQCADSGSQCGDAGNLAGLDSGKHTTTHATLYHLDADSDLIDSPGLQEFGLGHLDRQEIEIAFREFRPYLGQCRFRDCRHDREPGCALHAAVEAGTIDPGRFASYHRIVGNRRDG
jgi:ribosome biogenesis GTPase